MRPLVVLQRQQVVEALLADGAPEHAGFVGLLVVEQRAGVPVRPSTLITPILALLAASGFRIGTNILALGTDFDFNVLLVCRAAMAAEMMDAAAGDAAAAADDRRFLFAACNLAVGGQTFEMVCLALLVEEMMSDQVLLPVDECFPTCATDHHLSRLASSLPFQGGQGRRTRALRSIV